MKFTAYYFIILYISLGDYHLNTADSCVENVKSRKTKPVLCAYLSKKNEKRKTKLLSINTLFFIRTSNFGGEAKRSYIFLRCVRG